MKKNHLKNLLMFIFVIFTISNLRARTIETDYEKLDVFSEAFFFIKQSYLKNVENKEVLYGAIGGMLETLDEHSLFMPPEVFQEFKSGTEGSFSGIGVEISIRKNKILVIAPIEGSPADRAGILPGDEIIKIDDKLVSKIPISEIFKIIRGPSGSPLSVTVKRTKQTKTFKIIRQKIKVESVNSQMLQNQIAYFRIKIFQKETTDEFLKHYKKLKSKAKNIKGIIIDLRNNAGGLLEQAILLSNEFLSKGKIVSIEYRDKTRTVSHFAEKKSTDIKTPIVVLLNKGSASASEIVAGAFKDHKRASILGQKSFGKGTVQSVMELSDKSGLKLTVAKYFTPNGKCIHEKGISPNIKVAMKKDEKMSTTDTVVLKAVKHLIR